jgi:hypothetical protein
MLASEASLLPWLSLRRTARAMIGCASPFLYAVCLLLRRLWLENSSRRLPNGGGFSCGPIRLASRNHVATTSASRIMVAQPRLALSTDPAENKAASCKPELACQACLRQPFCDRNQDL